MYFLLAFFIVLAIVAANAWHLFASWFVHREGPVAGFLLLAVVLLLARLLDPYWER